MAFWGIEVKPGKPFTLTVDGVRRRLHISQATLAIGSSKQTSLVQCNIGNKSPVLLCALLPDKTESLQLNLEFEEDEEVIFSVIGPRGVHLTGYYVGIGRGHNFDDESESYGEDIANSEDEGSVPRSDEDEYEDSFIDDDDDNPEVLPPSPVSTDEDERRNKTHTCKRLKKNYQTVESDGDSGSWQQNTGNCIRSFPENETEDSLPISSLRKTKRTAKNKGLKSGDPSDASTRNNDIPVEDVKPERTMSKKPKDPSNEGNTLEADAANHSNTDDKAQQGEANKGAVVLDALVNSEFDHDHGNNKGSNLPEKSVLPSTASGKPKKKRKERAKEERFLEATNGNHITNHTKNKHQQSRKDDMEADDVDRDLPVQEEHDQRPFNNTEIGLPTVSLLPTVKEGSESIRRKKRRRKEQDQKTSTDKNIDIVSERIAEVDISEKKTKRKHKSKIQKNEQNADIDVSVSSKGEKEATTNELQEKNVNAASSQVRTLSNGLVIEELESTKSDGKMAAPGRKLKVLYTAKLKENGQIIDSNIGKAPYRFRLGDQQVIEGWNAGLDGMRAGDKRRLVIPPSLGYGSRGTPENVPPNSWLVYDVEVTSVH